MITIKKKLPRRRGGILGFILAALLIASMLVIVVSAESATSPDMSDIMPDGTNIPDTDIGGATGNDSSLIPDATTAPYGSTADQKPTSPIESIIDPESSMAPGDSTDEEGMIGGILGVIIAIIVVIAIIILLVLLIPKRDNTMNGREEKHDKDHHNKNNK